MSERAAPFYCPYCGDEDLRPSEAAEGGHGAWECAACSRAFSLKFLGLLAQGVSRRSASVWGGRAPGGPPDGGVFHRRPHHTPNGAPEANAGHRRGAQRSDSGGAQI